MPRIWRYAPHDEGRVKDLSTRLRMPALVAQVLVARGYHTEEDARGFLEARIADLHPPERLPGISEAVPRILRAIEAGRRITVYGDYDVDGVTGTTILWHCLKLAGAHVDYYIPSRLEEGYGLNCEALQQLHAEDPERIVVTVDCGIASVREAALAREIGLELIVTDHHQFAETFPEADCLVHPRLPGGDYPFGELCGAGVALKLAWGICQQLGDGKKASPRMREFLMGAVGLAAIGTVADVVPLVGENRVIVRYGLRSLVEHATPGLKALMQVAGIEHNGSLQSEDVGFALAPRINATGRLGQARLAVELLTTHDEERAAALASYLDELNKNRQTVERRMFKQARELVKEHPEWEEHAALVLAHEDWHPGVIGIVASRVAERFEKPAVLISLSRQEGPASGSGRSFAGFDLHAGLSACAEHLVTFGGHPAAAGLKVDPENIDAFRESLAAYAAENHEVTDRDRELFVDAEVGFSELTRGAVTHLDRIGPFGRHNHRPVFAASKVELVEPPRKMGGGERHLSLRVRHHGKVLRAVAFGRAEWADEMQAVDGPICISFAPNINRFQGRERVELQLIDWHPGPHAPLAGSTSSAVGRS